MLLRLFLEKVGKVGEEVLPSYSPLSFSPGFVKVISSTLEDIIVSSILPLPSVTWFGFPGSDIFLNIVRLFLLSLFLDARSCWASHFLPRLPWKATFLPCLVPTRAPVLAILPTLAARSTGVKSTCSFKCVVIIIGMEFTYTTEKKIPNAIFLFVVTAVQQIKKMRK